MGSFRNLIDGFRLGLSMMTGAFLGFMCFTPIIGSNPAEDNMQGLYGVPVGAIAGGLTWKCYTAWRDWPKPPNPSAPAQISPSRDP